MVELLGADAGEAQVRPTIAERPTLHPPYPKQLGAHPNGAIMGAAAAVVNRFAVRFWLEGGGLVSGCRGAGGAAIGSRERSAEVTRWVS